MRLMGITPAGALAFLIFLVAFLMLLAAGLTLLAGILGGVGMYWVTSGQWRHAGRILIAFLFLSLVASIGMALFGIAILSLNTGERLVLSTYSWQFPQLVWSGTALLCSAGTTLVLLYTRIFVEVRRRQGNPPNAPLV
jgi:hypothetical protein